MPQVTLAIVEGREAGQEFPVTGKTLIGRDPAADVVIVDTEVSTKHASFVLVNDGVAIEDHGSTNGTFVNGRRITGSQQLQTGDQVRLGATVVEVRGLEPPAEPDVAVITPEVTRARQIPTLPLLIFVAGQHAGTEMPVGEQLVVGRDPGVVDVVLDQDTSISRRHAAFAPAGAGLTVQDLGSTNGTSVNGHRLQYAVTLATGDRVQLGDTTIDIRLVGETVAAQPAAPAPRPQFPAQPPTTSLSKGS